MKRKGPDPTILEVAARAGVSIATVSRVLNDKGNVRSSTADRVIAAMTEVGYPHDATPPNIRNGLIVVVLPNLDNPFYAKIIKGIQTSAKGRGLETLLYNEGSVDTHSVRLLNLLHMIHAGGLILLSPVNDVAVLRQLEAAVPLVQCAEYNEQCSLPYVSVDDFLAAKSAVQTLLDKGCRRIALINGPDKYKYARQRFLGYAEALREAGLPVDGQLIFHVTEMGFDTSLSVARQLILATERPDAILATSDMFAAAVVKAANSEGVRIPEELSLIGFDNTYISQMLHPSVTDVNMPQFQLGYMACEILADRMANPAGEAKQFLLKTELVLRDST